ncbi:MAG: 4'-phosphopantetheinyl transferase superfamily protein [Vulcanimicrobiaceae bacterium]
MNATPDIDALWPVPERYPERASDAVHVWRAEVAQHACDEGALFALLDARERDRARRFHFARDRRRYVVSHGILRLLLGRYAHEAPERLRFEIGPFGKPRLVEAAADEPLLFNLSHAGGLAVIAIAPGRSCGVDVEQCDGEIEHAALAAFCFSETERATLAALPRATRSAGFFAAWTRKEAYIKATGFGVSQGLDHFDVSLAPGTPARLIADRHIPGAERRWTMYDLSPGFGYDAAVVAAGADWRLERYAFCYDRAGGASR